MREVIRVERDVCDYYGVSLLERCVGSLEVAQCPREVLANLLNPSVPLSQWNAVFHCTTAVRLAVTETLGREHLSCLACYRSVAFL